MKKQVVITRPCGPYEGGSRFAERVATLGFEPIEFPLLRCVTIPLSADIRQQLVELHEASSGGWLVFLSPTAIWAWKNMSTDEPLMRAAAIRASIAVQGVGTANACRECLGRSPDFIPSVFVAEDFAKELSLVIRKQQRIIVAQSAEGRDLIAPTLTSKGFNATSFSLYQLEANQPSQQMLQRYRELRSADTCVVFMSPSAVKAVVKTVGESLREKKLVSIGPITSRAIREAGLDVWQEASEHSEDGVLRILKDWGTLS